ncbi:MULTISPECIES: hypothetical protein [Streptomyces]|uniref:hypothetical protein n=1 Tax=Streptomyces TaxID=1883 RepID=UPI0005BE29F2|nr:MULTISPECIES: hypothetical protein [Streptomyces]MCM1945851.1 hypothetical protein [Streptomyces sp. G2]GHG11746.1 hypothetical protein GCM10018784_25620 [Streptomyces hydrogenans]
MSLVLVAGAVIQCTHQGRLTLAAGDPRVTVKGRGVVLAGKENGLVFGSPTTPAPGMLSPCSATTPAGVPQPCALTPATPDGWSRKLTVGGTPVLLATASGVTASGAGPGRWTVSDPGQNVLETL